MNVAVPTKPRQAKIRSRIYSKKVYEKKKKDLLLFRVSGGEGGMNHWGNSDTTM